MKWRGLEERVTWFADKNFSNQHTCCGINVLSLSKALEDNKKYLIAIADEEIVSEVKIEIEK